jgi:hypothetical protein
MSDNLPLMYLLVCDILVMPIERPKHVVGILCYFDGVYQYMRVIKLTICYYLSSVYSVTTNLHVSGLLVAHHQEVTMHIYVTIGKYYTLVGKKSA